MKTRLLVGAVAATLAASGVIANAQVYGDLRGQTASFTGTLNAAGTVSATVFGSTVFSESFAEQLILENPPLGTSGGGITYELPISLPFPNTGPPDDSMLTGTYPLPSITIDGQTIQLPTLDVAGKFNRTTGAFEATASAPGTTTVNATISGVQVTLNVTDPNITFDGQAITAPGASPLIIQDTQPAVLNVGLSGSALNGLAQLHFSDVDINFSQFDFTFPNGAVAAPPAPEPSALPMAASALLVGGSVIKRRRR